MRQRGGYGCSVKEDICVGREQEPEIDQGGKYLITVVMGDVKSEVEIRNKVELTKDANRDKKNVLPNRKLSGGYCIATRTSIYVCGLLVEF